ncbi:MAG: glycosyltransferase family 4 protein [Firmicutes bacterium]|nr:glycosyltransferase family 4 protein [Bacillota bacterium]
MNILIDASAATLYRSTGIGAYASELIHALKDLPIAEHISVFNGKTIHGLREEEPILPATHCNFWEIVSQNRTVSAMGFDLYHNLHNGIGMKTGSKNTLVTIHDMIPFVLPQYCGSPYKEIFLKETPKAIAEANHIITVSENSKKDILHFSDIDKDRITVIGEAAKHRCKPLQEKMCRDFLSSHYGIKPPFFLYVGGFNRRKNVSSILRGYAAVYRRFPRICPLVIVGKEGNRRKVLEKLTEELHIAPYVHFCGFVPDGELPFFYNLCEALIYPSFYEGFGLPPLEAAACGTAVITADNSSLKEIMAEGALYIHAENPQDIGEKLLALAKDDALRRAMAKRAYQRSLYFSYKKTAEQTASIYENLCRQCSDTTSYCI